MKIAFVLPNNGISGGLFVAYRHAHHLASRGHDVTVAFCSAAEGLAVTAYPNFNLPVRHLPELVATGTRFDAVISGWWECFYAMFQLKADRYLHFIQGDDRDALREAFGAGFAEQSLIDLAFTDPRVGYLTVARWLKQRLERDADIAVSYAPNGIDLSLFHPDVVPIAPRGDRPRVLIEGSGISFKRVDLAFDVARQIPGIEVWHVSGDQIFQDHWRADRRFCRLPMQQMPAIYSSCDVLLKLSIVEGFFGPPLEMMACGGTAVVTRVNGHDEYVVDGHNALTVPLDDGAAALAALRRVVTDVDLRRRLSANGLSTAREFGWERQCVKFEQGLLELLDRIPVWTMRDRAGVLAQQRIRDRIAACENEFARQSTSRQSAEAANIPSLPPAERGAKSILRKILQGIPLAERLASRMYGVVAPETEIAADVPTPGLPEPPANQELALQELISAEPDVSAEPIRFPGPVLRGGFASLGTIAFAGQPEYFRAAYFDAVHSGEHFEFPVTSADPGRLRGLPAFAKRFGVRTCIVFRPEWLAACPGVVEELQSAGIRVVGYSTEPVPTRSTGAPHADLAARLAALQPAASLPLDLMVHFDQESERFLHKRGFQRLICHPLPVSERLFYPEDVPAEFEVCFLGRSTSYRERMLAPLKSQLRIVHVAHGLSDEHARSIMNRSQIVLNLHNEEYPNFETRVVQALRCRRWLVSEPLTGSRLIPGRDFVEVTTPQELLQEVTRLLRETPLHPAPPDLSLFTMDSLLSKVAAALELVPARMIA